AISIGVLVVSTLDKRGWNMPVPEAASFRNVSLPAPVTELVVRLTPTVPAALVVDIALSAVTLIGYAIGALVGLRSAVVFNLPPLSFRAPEPLPSVPSASTLIVPPLIVVPPEYVFIALKNRVPVPFLIRERPETS